MSTFDGGGLVGSKEELDRQLEESQNWDTIWVRSIPQNGELRVRFLTDPDQFYKFFEHWGDSVKSYYACKGAGSCPGCDLGESEQDKRRSKRYLANALDVESGRVVPLKLPLDVVNRLTTRWERYNTLTDRDYIISRTGKGLNTVYDVETGEKDALDVSEHRKEAHDLEQVLLDQWEDAWGDGADEKRAARESKKEVTDNSGKTHEVDDEDMEEKVLTEEDIRSMKVAELEEVAEQLGLMVHDEWKKADLIEAILKEAEDA